MLFHYPGNEDHPRSLGAMENHHGSTVGAVGAVAAGAFAQEGLRVEATPETPGMSGYFTHGNDGNRH